MDITTLDVKCTSCDEIVRPEGPKHKLVYAFGAAAVFALFFGVGVGSTIGIATAGLGIAATLPLGLIGAYAGYKLGNWVAGKRDGVTCPACGQEFAEPSRLRKLRSVVGF